MALATIKTESAEHVGNVRLRVLVDKEKKRAVYAEAGKDFVDVLFSFLTLPLGTIARLVAKESNIEAVKFGSISSLHQSVSDLDQQYLSNQTCKEMLLNPRNSMEAYRHNLKLNIDDTEPMQYFRCNRNCEIRIEESEPLLSIFRNKKCRCGDMMNTEVISECLSLENGFIKGNASFIISDDLHVMPNVFGASLHLLQKHGYDSVDAIEEQMVGINKKEVVDLLKLLLISKSPLTDFVFKSQSFDNSTLRNNVEFQIGELPLDEARQMSVKVTLRKSNEEILFVEADDAFIDFVFSFLTFPLGGVLYMLQGFSSLSCIDNLYKSLAELSPDIYFMSEEIKDKLTKPLIAAQFELNNQILPIAAGSLPMNYCHIYYDYANYSYVTKLTKEMGHLNPIRSRERFVRYKLAEPKSSTGRSSFAKGPSMYMVTDDLFVSPMLSISIMSYLKKSRVPLSDLEERVIKIGVKEGLNILRASLTSTSALTNGLNQFIRDIKENEKTPPVSALQRSARKRKGGSQA